jgi:hypothetical protein
VKSTLLASVAVLAGVLFVSGPVSAHHGTSASYDLNKPTQISGVVTEFVWANPHARIFIDVTDAQGKVVNWGVEMRPAPNGLSRAGWTRHMFMAGDKISMTVFPSRYGTPTGVGEPDFPILKNGELVVGTGGGGRRGGVGRGAN